MSKLERNLIRARNRWERAKKACDANPKGFTRIARDLAFREWRTAKRAYDAAELMLANRF